MKRSIGVPSRAQNSSFHAESFDVNQSIADILHPLRLRTTDKGVQLDHVIAHDVPARLVGDLGRIRQMLFNLAGNALKFTEQGSIRVDA
jgi:signal transduction histidine kinase